MTYVQRIAFKKEHLASLSETVSSHKMHEAVEACKNDGYQQKVVQISRIEAHMKDEVEVVLHECTLVDVPVKATQFSNAMSVGDMRRLLWILRMFGKCGSES